MFSDITKTKEKCPDCGVNLKIDIMSKLKEGVFGTCPKCGKRIKLEN